MLYGTVQGSVNDIVGGRKRDEYKDVIVPLSL